MHTKIETTSRQLAYDALAHKEPERIPYTLYLAKPLYQKMEAKWGPREQWPCPSDDIIRLIWNVEVSDISSTGFKDRFGCQWKRDHGGCVFFNPPLTEPDVDKIPEIDLVPESDIQLILETRRKHPDQFIFYQFTCTFGERLWNLRGMEQTLMDYLIEPAFVHGALDKLMGMHLTALDKLLVLPVDGITIGDDFGSQRGPMIGRDIFLKFFKARLAKMYGKIRLAHKVTGHHSCGDNTILMGDFIDIGVQVFHPLQPEAMDISAIKREYGKHLTFRGGIGTQGAIASGTPEQARNEVRSAVEILSRGGGYFLETAKPLPEETPVENAMAVIEQMCRAMNYDFG